MSNNTYKVTVLDVPRTHLVGNWMFLNAVKDYEDYELLWQVFSNRLNELPGLGEKGVSYGVCANLQENLDCNYWTAVENVPNMPIPKGMVPIVISEGAYACLTSGFRISLDEAYDYLGGQWERSQGNFVVDRDKPCFEQYDNSDALGRSYKLFVPLKPRCGQHTQPDLPADIMRTMNC